MIRDLNPGSEARFFLIRPYRPWGPYSVLYNGYRVFIPTVKCPGRGVDQRDLNPGREVRFFLIRPDRPWGPYSLLYNGYRVFIPTVKCPARGVDEPLSSSVEVKEEAEL
jgi:hypothetical protein